MYNLILIKKMSLLQYLLHDGIVGVGGFVLLSAIYPPVVAAAPLSVVVYGAIFGTALLIAPGSSVNVAVKSLFSLWF
jgi:hypothetical protein